MRSDQPSISTPLLIATLIAAAVGVAALVAWKPAQATDALDAGVSAPESGKP